MEKTTLRALKHSICALLLAAAFGPWSASAQNAEPTRITRVSYSRGPRYGRVVIEAEREVRFNVRQLSADAAAGRPNRIFVDLTPAVRSAEVHETLAGQGVLISQVRVGQYDAETVRVVIDLETIRSHQVVTLFDPFRVVLDVYGTGESEAKAAASAATAPLHEESEGDPIAALLGGEGLDEEPAAPEFPQIRAAPPPRKPLVVIDPGHGGKDPGAVGSRGVKEKDVVLQIAKKLSATLKDRGHRVLLTREKDVYLTLSERTALANEQAQEGDLFVSIHANASPSEKASGIETYYWNVATDRSNASTIARENFTNLDAVFRHESSDLKAILSDLKYKDKERASAHLAGLVQKGMLNILSGRYKGVRDNGVHHGPLYVLALTNVPAVLVETSFISHPTEEKRLRSGDYQQGLADGIIRGIENYLREVRRGISAP